MADVAIVSNKFNIRINHEEEKTGDPLEILSTNIKDRFEIIKRLGSGSFGEVFLAKDIASNTLCALKIERIDCKYPQLRIEQQIFLRMENCNIIFSNSFNHKHFLRSRLSINYITN